MVVFDPADKPAMSLEAYLIWLGAESEYAGLYPEKGLFKGDMKGFINSCKACTMDVIAANANVNVNAVDVFALHLYTRAELFGQINRAYRDNDKEEMAKWRVVVWHMCAAARRLPQAPGVYIRQCSASSEAAAPTVALRLRGGDAGGG